YIIFFFQAEDCIRYRNVTGVQTCALPIFFGFGDTRGEGQGPNKQSKKGEERKMGARILAVDDDEGILRLLKRALERDGNMIDTRSEERRVGKESSARR